MLTIEKHLKNYQIDTLFSWKAPAPLYQKHLIALLANCIVFSQNLML